MSRTRDRLEALLKTGVAALVGLAARRRRAPAGIPGPAFTRILVVRQHDQLGDMLCAVPLLHALRLRYPAARLALVASPVNYEIMRHHPWAEEVLLYDKKRFMRSPASALRFLRSLRSFGADLAVVPATVSVSLTSDLLALASGAPVRVGAASLHGEPNPSARCYTLGVQLDWSASPRRHQALRNGDVLVPLGIVVEDCSTVVGLTEEERTEAARELSGLRALHRIVIGFHPGAGKAENRWPAESFAQLANLLAADGCGIVITAGPRDLEAAAEMTALVEPEALLVQRRPLRQVAAVIDQLDLFVSNDTGIMHVAGGTAASLVALFGPTDPLQWAPVGKKNRFLASRDGEIGSISVEAVYDTVKLVLEEKKLK